MYHAYILYKSLWPTPAHPSLFLSFLRLCIPSVSIPASTRNTKLTSPRSILQQRSVHRSRSHPHIPHYRPSDETVLHRHLSRRKPSAFFGERRNIPGGGAGRGEQQEADSIHRPLKIIFPLKIQTNNGPPPQLCHLFTV